MSEMIKRHEYTWSDHSMTGRGRLGWGITASSSPDQVPVLREIEKIAAQVPADHAGGERTEGLSYSPVCGFVRFTCVSGGLGGDKRHNKLVHLYEMGKEAEPSLYMAELPDWEEAGGEYLAPQPVLREEKDVRDMIRALDMEEELPAFLRAIYSCLLGDRAPLAIFRERRGVRIGAEDSRQIMALIHRLIPPSLRPRAAYISCREEGDGKSPFLFGQSCGCDNIYLIHEREKTEEADPFFGRLAQEILSDSMLCRDFYERADEFLSACADRSNLLEKLEWIFYETSRENGKPALEFAGLSRAYPDLIFWGKEDDILAKCAGRVHDDLIGSESDMDEDIAYLGFLAGGVTVKTKSEILSELDRVSKKIYQADPSRWEQEMSRIVEDNLSLCREMSSDDEGSYGDSLKRLTKACQKKKDEAAGRKKGTRKMKRETEGKHSGPEEKALQTDGKEEENNASMTKQAIREGTDIPAQASVRAVEEEPMGALLYSSIPQGFMSGSFMFLAWYSIRIGHWKIAVGLLGMWLLIMINYDLLLLARKEAYPLWQVLGLCCIEGLVVQAVAWFLPTKYLRMVYFLVLGALTLVIQTIILIRTRRRFAKENSDE